MAVTGVELILAALAAGAVAGAKDTVSAAVLDAYGALRDAVRARLGGDGPASEPLEAREVEPGVWEIPSAEQLTASGADRDQDVLAAARRLVELLERTELTERAGPSAPKFQVELRDAKGVQVGDDNTMTINLG